MTLPLYRPPCGSLTPPRIQEFPLPDHSTIFKMPDHASEIHFHVGRGSSITDETKPVGSEERKLGPVPSLVDLFVPDAAWDVLARVNRKTRD